MSAKMDQFFDDVRDRLHAIDGWLQSVRAHIESLPEKVQKDLQNKLMQAHDKLQAEQKRVEKTRDDLKAQSHKDILKSPPMMGEWKAKPLAPEPNARAVEVHPAYAIDHAMAGIDEVRDSMLYVAVARLREGVR